MAALTERFRSRAADEAERITAALAARDWPLLKEVAHRISGSAALFGHAPLGELAADLEDAIDGKAGDEELRRGAERLLRGLRLVEPSSG